MTYGGPQYSPLQPMGYGAELAPFGGVGNFLSGIAPGLGGAIGGAFGNQQLGSAIGQGASPLFRLLPFQVDPMAAAYGQQQLAPAGWFGDALSTIAPVAGRLVGGNAGRVINTVGGLGRLLPFEMDPMAAYGQQQLAPAGWFGDALSTIAPVAGRLVGGNAGRVINTVGGLGRLLPFEMDPMAAAYGQQQLAPAGWFGDAISAIAPTAGRLVGGNAGRVISTVGGFGRLLPFEMDPMAAYGYGNAQLAPQGLIGGIAGGFAGGAGGRALGNWLGGRSGGNIGNQIGSTVGGLLGGLLPFQTDPWAQYQGGYGY